MDKGQPYGPTLTLPVDSLREDWERVNVAFMLWQADTLHKAQLAIQLRVAQDNAINACYDVKPQIQKIGAWDFATYDLPVDSVMREAQQVKIFVFNPSDDAVQLKCMDVSFRPAYLKPGVKGQSLE